MSEDIRSLEREIEETRARLDVTIDRLQDKLSLSGVADDLIGAARTRGFNSAFEQALALIRRNPVPVMLVAAGVGWLLHRASHQAPRRGNGAYRAAAMASAAEEPAVPVDVSGYRVYDPDVDPAHPRRDAADLGADPGTDWRRRA